jgi:hypothetical protein
MQETSPATFPKSIPSIFSANFILKKMCLNCHLVSLSQHMIAIYFRPCMKRYKTRDICMHVISTNTYLTICIVTSPSAS